MDEQQTEAYLDSEDYAEHAESNEDAAWEQAQVPYQKKTESLFSLFQRVWKTEDSSKVANLNNPELGRLDFSVRDTQYLALLGDLLHHHKFASFFRQSGEIILKTSASKKGWFTELFVSQKKYTQRAASVSVPGQQQSQGKSRWSLFAKQGQQQQDTQSTQPDS